MSLGQGLALLFLLVSLVPLALQVTQLVHTRAEQAAALARQDLERAAASLASALAADGLEADAGWLAPGGTGRFDAEASAGESLPGVLARSAAWRRSSDLRITLLSAPGEEIWSAGVTVPPSGSFRVERPVAGTAWRLRLERPSPRGLPPGRALWLAATTALALVIAGWLLVGRLEPTLRRPLRSVSAAMRRAAGGDSDARTQGDGGPPELERLGLAFNDLAATVSLRLTAEQRAETDGRELVASSQRLFESAVHAKKPWTRYHPTLIKAYVQAIGRHLAKSRESDRDDWVEVLQPAADPDPSPLADKRRRDPRHAVSDLWVEAPVKSKVADLSSSGLRLEGLEGLAVGESVVLTIRDATSCHLVRGRVSWCRLRRFLESRGEKLPVYSTGIRFAPESGGEVAGLLAGRLSREHVA